MDRTETFIATVLNNPETEEIAARFAAMHELDPAYVLFVAHDLLADGRHNIASQYFPGLLQTPDYAQAVADHISDYPSGASQTNMTLREARRERFLANYNQTSAFILTDAQLEQRVGSPAVMAAQLGHIGLLAQQENVHVRVLPSDAGPATITATTLLTQKNVAASRTFFGYHEVARVGASIRIAQTLLPEITTVFNQNWDRTLDETASLARIAEVQAAYQAAA